MNPGAVWSLLKEVGSEWMEDKVPRLAAALAYYAVFSLAPLLVIAIGVAGLAFKQETVQGQIVAQVQGLIGERGAEAIEAVIENASRPGRGIAATSAGIILLLFGASGVFAQLQDALDTIWEVKPRPGRGIKDVVKDRFFSFTMVLGTGFLLLVGLILNTALAALGEFASQTLPLPQVVLQVANFVISLGAITLLFALIYKIVPDVEVTWSDVWVGATATALLFTLGKFLIGLYLGHSTVVSAYGAAGSLVVIFIWIYYSAHILFLGAEFTQVYARRYGSRVQLQGNAVPVTEEAREEQGIPHDEGSAT